MIADHYKANSFNLQEKEHELRSRVTEMINSYCLRLKLIDKYTSEYIKNFKSKSLRFYSRLNSQLMEKLPNAQNFSKANVYSELISFIINMGSHYIMKSSLLFLIKVFQEFRLLDNCVLPDSAIIMFIRDDSDKDSVDINGLYA